jgi:dynein heavy chain 2
LTSELEQLPRRAQLAAGFVTYLSSAPEDVRRDSMTKWCDNIGLDDFDFRRFMSTESEQLGWKSEGLPSDDLSIENALVIMKVGSRRTNEIRDLQVTNKVSGYCREFVDRINLITHRLTIL